MIPVGKWLLDFAAAEKTEIAPAQSSPKHTAPPLILKNKITFAD